MELLHTITGNAMTLYTGINATPQHDLAARGWAFNATNGLGWHITFDAKNTESRAAGQTKAKWLLANGYTIAGRPGVTAR
jgi:hypothetical protein